MIENALILAQSANFEKHHQPEIDVRLLNSLKRPSTSLFPSTPPDVLLGDLKRFPDIFNNVLSFSHHEDMQTLFKDVAGVVEFGELELKKNIW